MTREKSMAKRLALASLTLNVVVLAALIWALQRQTPPITADVAAGARARPSASVTGSSLLRLHARLQGAGLDEPAAGRVLAQVLHSSGADAASAEYWKPSLAASRARALAQYDELQKARGAVRASIGELALDDPELAVLFRPYGSELDFLSPQKQMALQEVEMQDLRSARSAMPLDESAQIKAALSASEWQEYRYRRSTLRQRLLATGFDFTRDEYRAVFDAVAAARREREGALVAGIVGDPVREPQLAEQIRQALGAERFATFQKVQDPLYVTLIHVGKTQNLPAETIDAAYALVSQNNQGLSRSTGRAPLSPAQRDAELRGLLGAAAFDLFSRLSPRANSNQMAVFTVGR
jgi:hypothetical protein